MDGIRVVAEGDALLAPSVTRRLIDEFSRGARPEREAPPAASTSSPPRELEVFRAASRAACRTRRSPRSCVVSETTVKTHVARVLMKLGVRDRVQAVVLAYESGVVAPGSTVERVVEPAVVARARRRGRRPPGRAGWSCAVCQASSVAPCSRQRSAHAAISASACPPPRASSATKRSFITPSRDALSVCQVQKIVAKPTAVPSSARAIS